MTRAIPPSLSLYIHFPWCVAKCPYCDFNSHVHRGQLPHLRYIERLIEEMTHIAPQYDGRAIETIFMGGGTPSLFPPEHMHLLLKELDARWPIAANAEVTMEANPGALECGSMTGYAHAGINRVSMGAQSFDSALLKRLGRIHKPTDTIKAVTELNQAGIHNFNLDLMNQLPQQSVELALSDLSQAIALNPSHISLYELTIEPNTVFAANPPIQPDESISEEIFNQSMALLADAGYHQYEVSAFAKKDQLCRHNLNYWEFGDYLAIGAGAHGKMTQASGKIVRTENAKLPRDYLNGEWQQVTSVSQVSTERLPFEFLMNALRLKDGFTLELFTQRTGLPLSALEPHFERAVARGLLVNEAGRIRATERGYRYLNEVLEAFLSPL